MQKVGRNEPCPCGCGKKYKNCHLKTENNSGGSEKKTEERLPNANTFMELIQNYNCYQILKIIGVLQLQPANHKKYLRLEQMARLTLIELKNNQEHRYYAYWDLLKNAICSFTEFNYLEEDPPTLFTENVVFLHGNYIVYPGFNVTATKILNELFECIFLVENKLDDKFKTLVKDAAGLLLLLSNSMADFLDHKRFLYDAAEEEQLLFPEYDDLFKYLDSISFSKEFLQRNSEYYMFDRSILKEFTISLDNKGLENDDPDENTATLYPLIEIEGETVLYLVAGIIPALTNFINTKATEFNCLDEINRILIERQFEKSILALKHIGWKKLNVELPEVKESINIQEAVFQFDTQKIGYLCFINTLSTRNKSELKNKNISSNPFGDRNEQVIKALSAIATEHPVEILTLYVFAETGSDYMFAWPKSSGEHLSIPITYNELDAICYSEKSNALTLWQFVKTYIRTNLSATINTPGGTLDA